MTVSGGLAPRAQDSTFDSKDAVPDRGPARQARPRPVECEALCDSIRRRRQPTMARGVHAGMHSRFGRIRKYTQSVKAVSQAICYDRRDSEAARP